MKLKDWLKQVADYFVEEWGLNRTFAEKMATLYWWSQHYGMDFNITSGWRDPERQAALRERWDRGDRTGLRARPAVNSKHCHVKFGRPDSLALDVSSSHLSTLGVWASQYLGLRWGGDFRNPDPVHFDLK